MAERPTQLPTERSLAATTHADIVHKANYWSEDLRRRGLMVEGLVMYDLATEIMTLRAQLGAAVDLRPAHRGLVGDVYR